MPNYNVFNREPGQLKTQIYGSENDYALSTTEGRLNIESISADVNIAATDLDIRDLTYAQDTVRVYGSETYALSTTEGRLNIVNRSRYMASATETNVVSSITTYSGLLASDVSEMSNVSFAVHNKGANQVSIRIDVSPDNSLWITDTAAATIDGNGASVFVPKHFLKYSRIAYASLTDATAITFDAWYQAHV